jgi:hypothetical protein
MPNMLFGNVIYYVFLAQNIFNGRTFTPVECDTANVIAKTEMA